MNIAEDRPVTRRQYLGIGGTAVALGLAGCSMAGAPDREGVILTHVELGNASPDPEEFDVLVTHDGEIVHWALHEVDVGSDEDEMGGTVIDIDSREEPGQVEVLVRVGQQWERTDFDSDRYDGNRVIAVVTYGLPEDGVLRISRVISDRDGTVSG